MKSPNYRIVSVFHSPYPGAGRHAEFNSHKEALDYADNIRRGNTRSPLPNAPLPARDTLLAEILRAEKDFAGWLRWQSGRDFRPTGDSVARWLGDAYEFRAAQRAWRDECKSSRNEKRPKFDVKKNKTLVGKLLGVEIEYYPTLCQYECRYPSIENVVGDGSLAADGQEIRRLTWRGANGRLGIRNMIIAGRVDKLCGLHVHVDCRHLTEEQAAATYDRLEEVFSPFFKKLVPKSRIRNQYCHWHNNRSDRRGVGRYAAFNWHAYDEHQTIEFRMQGNFNPPAGRIRRDCLNSVAIETWALICQETLAWAADVSRPNPRNFGEFAMGLPEPLRSWVILRKETLWGCLRGVTVAERSITALSDSLAANAAN